MDFLKRLILFIMIPLAANATTTPLMNLSLPVPGTTLGPTWATMLNTALTTVDSHNHTSGHGALVPTAGLNINADLSLENYNLYNVNSVKLKNQAAALTGSTDVRSVYSVSGDLYYNNSSGTAVKLTSGNSLNVASLGVIGGDYGGSNPASVFYTDSTKTYSLTQSSGKTANLSTGPVSIFENATSALGVTIKSPTSLGAAYSLTLPSAQASANNVMKSDGSGTLSFGQVQTAEIADSAITTAKITDANVTTAKIVDGAVTQAKRSSAVYAIGSSSLAEVSGSTTTATDVSGLNVTITATGSRPVFITMVHDGTHAAFNLTENQFGTTANCQFILTLAKDGTAINKTTLSGSGLLPPGAYSFLDVPSAGSHTYKIQGNFGSTCGSSFLFWYVKLVAFEL